MHSSSISRRALLLAASAAGLGCGRRKATGIAGYCFVANQGSRTLAAVDLDRFRVVRQIPLEGAPSAVVAHPAKPKLFVLAPENGTVYEVDAATLTVARRARAGNLALDMRMSPAQDALWILYRDPAQLVELPLDSLRPGRRVRLAAPPDSFALGTAKDGRLLAAVAHNEGQTIAIASLGNSSIERTVATGAEPSVICFQSDGVQLIAGSRPDRSVIIFDVATGKTTVRLPLPLAPRHLCNTEGTVAKGGQIFITGDGMDAVVVLFPYSTEIYQTILAGHAPGPMAVTAENSKLAYLLVANPESDCISVLDFLNYDLVAVVQVGQGPGQILVTPDGQYALVLNEKSGDLAVIRTLSLATAPNGGRRRNRAAPLFTLIPVGERPVAGAVVTLG